MSSGTLNKCKECAKIDARARDKLKTRAYDNVRSKTDKRKAYTKIRAVIYRKLYPEKRRAHDLVAYALRNGKLKKLPCEVCGANKHVHGHHDDYTKPLEVVWLCPVHHKERHAMLEKVKK